MTATRARAIFLDVDGTYADHGQVPAAHVDAVQAARRAGHRVLLCTGRPAALLPAPILAAGFDGVVAAAGAYVRCAGRTLRDVRFPSDVAARVVAFLDEHRTAYLLETPDAIAVNTRTAAALTARDGTAPPEVLDVLHTADDLSDVRFGKLSYFAAPVPLDVVRAGVGPEVDVLPSSYVDDGGSGEIQLAGVHKATGIQAAIDHLGIDRADVVAVGDGHNDVEMLAFAGTAVAVEGAPEVVLAEADLTVPGPASHGVATAFDRLGLLDGTRAPADLAPTSRS